MDIQTPETINIVSLFDGDLEERFNSAITPLRRCSYRRIPMPPVPPDFTQQPGQACAYLTPIVHADVIVVHLTGRQLDQFYNQKNLQPATCRNLTHFSPAWPAVIAVLTEDDLRHAAIAASLDFDGIIAQPFETEHIRTAISQALQRHENRIALAQRYNKMRSLCKGLNQKRRQLRDKVDLLCRDLVGSNAHLTQTLHRLADAYDLQTILSGEFDLQCMMHKALRHITDQITQTNAALYLLSTDDFAAHIHQSDSLSSPGDLLDVEAILTQTILQEVLFTQGIVHVPDAGVWNDAVAGHVHLLENLSMIGAQLTVKHEPIAVLVVYRRGKPLTREHTRQLKPFLPPLARAIQSLQALEQLIA